MWLFKTYDEQAIELAAFVQEWMSSLNETPSREEIQICLDAAKELLSISKKMRSSSLNAVSRHLVEALSVWYFNARHTNGALNDDPCYKNALHYANRLEDVISRTD